MRKLLFILTLSISWSICGAQSLPDFSAIKLDKKEDFNNDANAAALQAASFLLSTPMEKDNLDRLYSLQYIIRWMTGSPDYSFTFDAQATKFAKKNDDLLGLYMAAMTKFVLENKAASTDEKQIKLNAVKIIVAYARDENNKVKINSELKRAMEADAKGTLAEYLKI